MTSAKSPTELAAVPGSSSVAKRVSVLGVMVPEYVARIIDSYKGEPIEENWLMRYRGMGRATLAKLKAAGLKTIAPIPHPVQSRNRKIEKLLQKEAKLIKLQSDVAVWLTQCRADIERMNASALATASAEHGKHEG